MADVEKIASVSKKTIDKVNGVINWFNTPKEEARQFLLTLIKDNDELTPEQQLSLIYNSRKFTREYGNSKTIYEEAKKQFTSHTKETDVDDDWLHFFFDKAEKVSNKGMQLIWARLLAGEFNRPGSISRKLMHIISIMDVHSAHSFRTFSYYVFERNGMFTSSYDTDAVLIPDGFHIDSFDFLLKTEKWLDNAGFSDYKDLAIDLTLNTGELNSLENLGLVQKVPDSDCGLTLIYHTDDFKEYYLIPQNDSSFPLGIYSFTTEGKQLYDIIGCTGCRGVFEIIKQYLNEREIDYLVTTNE